MFLEHYFKYVYVVTEVFKSDSVAACPNTLFTSPSHSLRPSLPYLNNPCSSWPSPYTSVWQPGADMLLQTPLQRI